MAASPPASPETPMIGIPGNDIYKSKGGYIFSYVSSSQNDFTYQLQFKDDYIFNLT